MSPRTRARRPSAGRRGAARCDWRSLGLGAAVCFGAVATRAPLFVAAAIGVGVVGFLVVAIIRRLGLSFWPAALTTTAAAALVVDTDRAWLLGDDRRPVMAICDLGGRRGSRSLRTSAGRCRLVRRRRRRFRRVAVDLSRFRRAVVHSRADDGGRLDVRSRQAGGRRSSRCGRSARRFLSSGAPWRAEGTGSTRPRPPPRS